MQRQAFAGLLWTKQCYQYVVETGSRGIRASRRRPRRDEARAQRTMGPSLQRRRNLRCQTSGNTLGMRPGIWRSMRSAGDGGPEFAKEQLKLFLREWYMHPNGQIPAYEWALGDVNPPVHAWACWRVYRLSASSAAAGLRVSGKGVSQAAAEFHLVGEPQGSSAA